MAFPSYVLFLKKKKTLVTLLKKIYIYIPCYFFCLSIYYGLYSFFSQRIKLIQYFSNHRAFPILKRQVSLLLKMSPLIFSASPFSMTPPSAMMSPSVSCDLSVRRFFSQDNLLHIYPCLFANGGRFCWSL